MTTLILAQLTALIFGVCPTYDEVVRTDLIAHAKIRWSRMDVGQRIIVDNALTVTSGYVPPPRYVTDRKTALS